MALQDMSDNANTFGTDMASIQNAYQGFAKSNYSMLDNLKLGYGGTKTEMQRLLKDAQKIKRAQGENVRYSINNLDDVYEAIHVIQQEMGITGTTASEAAKTISGSYNATMAAWSNIMTGLGTEQEMDEHIRGFVESGTNLVTNVAKLLPKVAKSFMEEVVPMASEWASELMGKAADAGAGLLANIYTGLTGEETTAEQVKTFFGDLGTDAVAKFNEAKSTASDFLGGFYSALTADEGGNKENIIKYFEDLWANVGETATSAKSAAKDLLSELYTFLTGQEATPENVGETVGAVAGSVGNFVSNATGAISDVTSAAANWIDGMQEGDAEKRREAGVEQLSGMAKGASAIVQGFVDAIDAFRGKGFTESWMAEASGYNEARAQKAAELGVTLEELDKMGVAANYDIGGSRETYTQDPGILQAWNQTQEQNANVVKSQTELIQMIGNMWGDASMLGLTESQLDDWLSVISSGKKDDEYFSVAQAVMEAFRQYDEDDSEETPVNTSTTINVLLDGQQIGAVLEESVVNNATDRVMRQFRRAEMVTA